MASPDPADPVPASEPAPDDAPPSEGGDEPGATDADASEPEAAEATAEADDDADDAADADGAADDDGHDLDVVDALDVLATTERERDEYLDRLQRLQADFENYKKRMQRQQADILERAGEDLASKLLPVLDTIDLARQHGAGEGVDQIATALVDVLTKEGLERIDPVGEPFDPNEHEAVSHEPADDASEPSVSGLMRAGYRWKGRLVRAAMVTVRG